MHLRLCPSTLRPRGSAGWVSSSRISFPSHLQSSRSSVPHRRASVRWFVSSTTHRGGRKKWTFKPKPNAESPDASTGAGNHPRETRDTRETPQPVQRSDLPGPGPVPKLPFMSPRGFSEHAEELRRALAEKKSEFRAPDGQSQREIEIQAWKDVEAKLRSVHRADGVANIPINPNLPFEGEGIVTRETKIIQPQERLGKDPETKSAINRRIRLARRIGRAIEMILTQKIWEMDAKAPDKKDPFVVSLRSHGFHVNSIRLSRDLSNCTVRWNISKTLEPETVDRLLRHTPSSLLPEAMDFGTIIQGMLDKYSKEIQYVIARDMDLKRAPVINFVHDWRAERDENKALQFQSAARVFRKQRRAMRLELLERQGVPIPEEHRPHMRLHAQMTAFPSPLGDSELANPLRRLGPDTLDKIEELQKMAPEEREATLLKMYREQKR